MKNTWISTWLHNYEATGAIVEGDKRINSEELHFLATSVATKLISDFRIKNNLIAVFLPKSSNIIITNLGILLSGNFYTNIDTKLPTNRLRILLKNLNPSLIITDKLGEKLLNESEIPGTKIIINNLNAQPDFHLIDKRLNDIIDTDPSMIINTSGSTGIPKSVLLSHRNTSDFLDWVTSEFDFNGLSIGSLSPYHFDIYTMELGILLFNKCEMHIIPERLALFPDELIDYLVQKSVQFIFWVPTILVNIVNKNIDISKLSNSLKRVFFAGEVFPTKQLNLWLKNLPSTQFVNLYGPIEIAVDCTFHILSEMVDEKRNVPIGIPCKNSRVTIVNDREEVADIDQVGELWVSGSSLAIGYYNNPELTKDKFIMKSFRPGYSERYYRTGDLASKDKNGLLHFHGRSDTQIKHLGYRIELSEVEIAANSLTLVRNSVALYNSISKLIILIYEAESSIDIEFLRDHFSNWLPKYMMPARFYHVSTMPMNSNGKIDRKYLDEKFLQFEL